MTYRVTDELNRSDMKGERRRKITPKKKRENKINPWSFFFDNMVFFFFEKSSRLGPLETRVWGSLHRYSSPSPAKFSLVA